MGGVIVCVFGCLGLVIPLVLDGWLAGLLYCVGFDLVCFGVILGCGVAWCFPGYLRVAWAGTIQIWWVGLGCCVSVFVGVGGLFCCFGVGSVVPISCFRVWWWVLVFIVVGFRVFSWVFVVCVGLV